MKIKTFLFDIFMLFGLSLICYFLKIRFCPFYYFFKIPCPGCGLTRSMIELLKGNLLQSLRYNILGIFIFSFLCIYILLWCLRKDSLIENILKKYEIVLIILSFVL